MSRLWYAHCPGWATAVNVYGANQREARANFRKSLSLNRLPVGSAVWLA